MQVIHATRYCYFSPRTFLDARLRKEKASDMSHASNCDLLQQAGLIKYRLLRGGVASQSSHASHETAATDTTSSSTQVGLLDQCGPDTKRATLRINSESLQGVGVQAIGLSAKDALCTAREELILTQSQRDAGFTLQVTPLCQNQKDNRHNTKSQLLMELIFDPNSDMALLFNKKDSNSEESIMTVRQLPLSSKNAPTNVRVEEFITLDDSSYRIYMLEEHIFDITIFPRRYISFVTEPVDQQRTNKRAFEPILPQQDPMANKRAKLMETSEGSCASTVFQTAPTYPLSEEPVVSSALSRVSDSTENVVPGLCHPLEELGVGGTLKIVSDAREDDYKLTRGDNISDQGNSLVYKADYSQTSARVVVVKIWRSKLDSSTDPSSALTVSAAGKYWLNEVQNHLKVGLHVS